jgi:hypothetical protein
MEVFMSAVARLECKTAILAICLLLIASVTVAIGEEVKTPDPGSTQSEQTVNSAAGNQNEINQLKRQLADQQRQIDELRRMLEAQAKPAGNGTGEFSAETQPSLRSGSRVVGEVASAAPMIPVAPKQQASAKAISKPSAEKVELPAALRGFKPIGLFYLSYQAGKQYSGVPDETSSYNWFTLKRGYFGADVDITSYLTSRWVGDVYQDSTGDWKVRAKYLYGKFHWKGNTALTSPYMEFGLVHMPWLDWEEAMNGFRMQDTMFLERNNVFNSADVGVLAGSDIGGSMSSDYKKDVNSHYAGRYGSWQVGVYNGTGYHAAEQNTNKVFEGRLSIRPVPDHVAGLQFTVFGVVGKGNKAVTTSGVVPPDWNGVNGMVSYESKYFTLTGQGWSGTGNQAGTVYQPGGTVAAGEKGWSVFASAHIPTPHFGEMVSIIGRYDEFNSNTSIYNDLQRRYIAGVAWRFYKSNTWLLDYQRLDHSVSTIPGEGRIQLTLQTAF